MKRFREPVNGFTHLVGGVLALAGLLWLVVLSHDNMPKMIAMLIFGGSMILVYAASTTYHLWNGSERMIRLLRRIDHAAIYIMIGGTYTPFAFRFLSGRVQWVVLGIVWGMALIGVVFKLFFFRAGHLSTLYYLAMGWVGLAILPELLPVMDSGLVWLIAAGGLVYSLGAVVYALEKPNFHPFLGHHELWHLFVMTGSVLHFSAVRLYLI